MKSIPDLWIEEPATRRIDWSCMDPKEQIGNVAGLNLYIAGSFDPQVFLDGLGLQASQYEQSVGNSVTRLPNGKPPVRFMPSRTIQEDRMAFVVPGPRSIPELFDALFLALANLSPAAKSAWDGLTSRAVDLGVNWTNEGALGTEYDLPPHVVRALGEAGVALRISVCATSGAIEKACQEARGGRS